MLNNNKNKVKRDINEIRNIVFDLIEIVLEKDIKQKLHNNDIKNYGMDSINIIQLIILIEERFEFEIPDNYYNIEMLKTVEKISTMIQKTT